MKLEKLDVDCYIGSGAHRLAEAVNATIDFLAEKYPEDFKDELKPLPCPFCGEFPMVGSYPGSVDTQHKVWCGNTDCPAGAVYTESCTSKEDAIEKWNRRAGK